jgi:hypothetical protein
MAATLTAKVGVVAELAFLVPSLLWSVRVLPSVRDEHEHDHTVATRFVERILVVFVCVFVSASAPRPMRQR